MVNIFENYEDVKYFYSMPDVVVVFLFLPRPWGFHKSFDGWHEYLWCGIMHFDETRAGRSRYSKQDPLFCGLTIWYMCKSERNVSSMKSMCKSTWTLLVTHPKPPTPNPAYKPSKSQEMPNKTRPVFRAGPTTKFILIEYKNSIVQYHYSTNLWSFWSCFVSLNILFKFIRGLLGAKCRPIPLHTHIYPYTFTYITTTLILVSPCFTIINYQLYQQISDHWDHWDRHG